MKTSWIETKGIEDYLLGKLDPQQRLVFKAGLLVNAVLEERCEQQQIAYHLVKIYGRKQLKAELEIVHQKLFSQKEHKNFREKVLSFFKTS